ncbi:MAG: hypothetical protein ACE3JU_11510, partial [Paenibacillus sp.]|uniref:hypothetical protein n=1 Tax=Paenibacillus sp. TaxID=58172 RepID=UPI003B79D6AF
TPPLFGPPRPRIIKTKQNNFNPSLRTANDVGGLSTTSHVDTHTSNDIGNSLISPFIVDVICLIEAKDITPIRESQTMSVTRRKSKTSPFPQPFQPPTKPKARTPSFARPRLSPVRESDGASSEMLNASAEGIIYEDSPSDDADDESEHNGNDESETFDEANDVISKASDKDGELRASKTSTPEPSRANSPILPGSTEL